MPDGPETIDVSGGVVSAGDHRPAGGCRREIDVAGEVGRADVERVRRRARGRCRSSARCTRPRRRRPCGTRTSRPPSRRTRATREVAVVEPDGADVIDVLGGVVSAAAVIVQVAVAGEVDVAGRVGRADVEGVRAAARALYAFGEVQAPHAAAVDAALERHGLGRGERERGRGRGRRARRAGRDRRVGRGRVRAASSPSTSPSRGSRRCCRPRRSRERRSCAPVGQPLYVAGDEQVRPRSAVDAALERRAGLGRGERHAGARRRRRARGRGRQRGVRRRGVDDTPRPNWSAPASQASPRGQRRRDPRQGMSRAVAEPAIHSECGTRHR